MSTHNYVDLKSVAVTQGDETTVWKRGDLALCINGDEITVQRVGYIKLQRNKRRYVAFVDDEPHGEPWCTPLGSRAGIK